MNPETILYLIRDRVGQIIGFPTPEEARECLITDSLHPGVEERSFGWLLDNQPKALIRIFSQYYWAEELA